MYVLLVARAWTELLYMDIVGLFGFRAIQRVVQRVPLARRRFVSIVPPVVDAVETACVLYVKPAKCLQRSAAVTRLLRRRGVQADMVIGCHPSPLRAHAWVEVAGEVVCEDLEDLETYNVLDRW